MHPRTTTVSCPSTFVRRPTLTALWPACFAAALALLSWVAEAQDLQPVGSEFQVNTTTALGQYQPSVALDAVGNFVVVWEGNDGSVGYNYDIFGQRYAADGSPRGDEFLVNTFTTDSQFSTSAAGNPAGAFVVVWVSDGDEPGAGGEKSVQGQRFDADGSPVASQFQISTYATSGLLAETDVAVGATGAFLVVWQSDESPGSDTDFQSTQARAFAADGAPVASQFQVNADTTGSQVYPAVSVDGDERFVVVWTSFDSPGVPDASRILARRYDAQGSALGDPFQIDDAGTGQKRTPAVAAAPDGSILVAWSSSASAGDADLSIQARRFAADDTPLEDQFQVNAYTTGNQQRPAVSFAADGRFVVAWQSRRPPTATATTGSRRGPATTTCKWCFPPKRPSRRAIKARTTRSTATSSPALARPRCSASSRARSTPAATAACSSFPSSPTASSRAICRPGQPLFRESRWPCRRSQATSRATRDSRVTG